MHRSISVLSLSLLLIAAGFAAAQEADYTLDDVSITATRVEEPTSKAPARVTVVTSDDIAKSGAQNVVEVLEKVPGVSFTSSSNAAQAQVSMRGFGENSFGRVLVLVDGRRLNNPDMQGVSWLSVSLADIDRIEVLDGGSSVLYGNSAVGGVINIITKHPKKGTASNLVLQEGSYYSNRQQFSVTSDLDKGGIAATAEHYSTDGYRDRSGYSTANASLRGNYDLSSNLTTRASVSMADDYYEMPGYLTEAQFKANPRQATNQNDDFREHSFTGELGASWYPSDKISVEVPLTGSYKNIAVNWDTYTSYTDRIVGSWATRPKATFETAAGTMPLRFIAGVDLALDTLNIKQYSDKARTTQTSSYTVSMPSVGPYVTGRIGLLDALDFEGGVRYDTAVVSVKNDMGSLDKSKTHSAFVYDASLLYRPASNLKTYLKYGTLFRYPFTDEQASVYGSTGSFNSNLEAETGYNLETGISAKFAPVLVLDANVYLMGMKNEIAYNSTTLQNENLDETRRIGGTLSLTCTPADFMELTGGYSYVDARFAAGSNKDKYIPLVPAHRITGTLTFKPGYGFSFGPTASFQSSCYQGEDYGNTQSSIDAFALYGLAFRFAPEGVAKGLEITAKVDNLLDTSYAPLQYYSSYSGTAYYPADGRTFTVSAGYRF